MEVTNESRSFIIGKSSRISPSDLLVAIRKNNNSTNAESSFTLKPLESLNSTVQSREGFAMISNLKELSTLDDALSPKKKQKAVVFLEANEYSDQSQTFMDSSEILTNRPKRVPKGILVRKGVGKSLPITPLRPKQENLIQDSSPTVQIENKKFSNATQVSQTLMQINKEIAASSQAAKNNGNGFVFSRPSRTLSFKQLGSNKELLRDEETQRSSKRGDGDFLNQNKSAGKISLRREYSESSLKRDPNTLNYRLQSPNIPNSRSLKFANQNIHVNSREPAKFFHKSSTSEGSRSKLSFLDKSPMQKQQPLNLLESFNEGEMSSFSQFDSPSFQLRSDKNLHISQKSLKDNYLFSNINLPFDDGANQSRNGQDKSQRASESPVTDRDGGFSQRVLNRQEMKPSFVINSITQLFETEKKVANPTGRRNSQQKIQQQQQISFLFNKQIVKYDLMKMNCETEPVPNSNNMVDNYSYDNMNNEYLFISGGMDRRNYSISGSAFLVDLTTLKVEPMPSLTPGRHSHTTVTLKHKIFVFGGQSIENKVLHGCCVFNIRERVWYKIPSMKMERKNAQFIVNQKSGVIYLMGGTNQNGNEIKIIEKLDTNKLSWNMLRYDTSIGLNLRDFIVIKAINEDENMVWILSRSKVMHEGQLVYRLYSFDLQQEKFAQEVEFTYFTDELVDFGFVINNEIHIVKRNRFNIVDVYLGNGRWIEKKF